MDKTVASQRERHTFRKQWTKAERITISNYAYVRTNQAHSLIQFIYLFLFKYTIWMLLIFGRRTMDMVPFWCAVCACVVLFPFFLFQLNRHTVHIGTLCTVISEFVTYIFDPIQWSMCGTCFWLQNNSRLCGKTGDQSTNIAIVLLNILPKYFRLCLYPLNRNDHFRYLLIFQTVVWHSVS